MTGPMKKLFSMILALCLICSCAFALADGLTFTTGGAAGTYYAFGTVLANYVSNNTMLSAPCWPTMYPTIPT